MDILKGLLTKMGFGYRYLCLGKFRECINSFNNVPEPLNCSHFVLVNKAVAFMHLVKYADAEKLFSYAFQRDLFNSYGLDYYRYIFIILNHI